MTTAEKSICDKCEKEITEQREGSPLYENKDGQMVCIECLDE